MPELNCKEYTGITRAMLGKFREGAARSGVTLPPGDSFVIEKSGVKVSIDYLEATQTLKACIVDKPGFVPASMVWTLLEDQMKRVT